MDKSVSSHLKSDANQAIQLFKPNINNLWLGWRTAPLRARQVSLILFKIGLKPSHTLIEPNINNLSLGWRTVPLRARQVSLILFVSRKHACRLAYICRLAALMSCCLVYSGVMVICGPASSRVSSTRGESLMGPSDSQVPRVPM